MTDKKPDIFRKLIKPKQVFAVYAHHTGEANTFYWCKVTAQKGTYAIADKGECTTLEELSAIIPPTVPLVLTIGGKGILFKQAKGHNPHELVHTLFPHTTRKEMEYTVQSVNPTHHWFSFIRKEKLNTLIDQFQQHNLYVASVALGPFIAQKYLSLLQLNATTIPLVNYIVQLKNGEVEAINASDKAIQEQELKGRNEKFSSIYTVPFLSAIEFIREKTPSFINETTENSFLEWFYRRTFQRLKMALPVGLFVILLVNFFAFDFLNKQTQTLQAQDKLFQKTRTEIMQLGEALHARQKFISDNGIRQCYPVYYIADNIAAVLPANIILSKMTVYPITHDKKRKQTDYHIYTIRIEGEASSISGFEQCVKALGNIDFVERIENQSFAQKSNDVPGLFHVDLKINQP